jgi:hypothetical protein
VWIKERSEKLKAKEQQTANPQVENDQPSNNDKAVVNGE